MQFFEEKKCILVADLQSFYLSFASVSVSEGEEW